MSIEWQETGGRLNHLLEQQLRSTIDLVDRIRRNAATQHVDFAHQFIAPARAEFQQRRSAFITILLTIVVKFDIGVRAHHQRSVTAASAATAARRYLSGSKHVERSSRHPCWWLTPYLPGCCMISFLRPTATLPGRCLHNSYPDTVVWPLWSSTEPQQRVRIF
jgi:hypothetical protein